MMLKPGTDMDEKKRFQFSLWNIMLMMVPLACIFAAFGMSGLKTDPAGEGLASSCKVASVALGVPMALGALWGGSRGMLRALRASFLLYVLSLGISIFIALMFFLLVNAIDFIIALNR